MKSQLAEVQTGFEPLLFHFQGDFCSQRPFSEGCGGWFSEKSGKIFHKVMGAEIGGIYLQWTDLFRVLYLYVHGADRHEYNTCPGYPGSYAGNPALMQGASCKK